MDNKVNEYLNSMKTVWAASTLRSERARLNSLSPFLSLPPEELWTALRSAYKPYTAQTAYTRICRFYDWMKGKDYVQENVYREYRIQHSHAFRNLYERRRPRLTFDEARARISKIHDDATRTKAVELLNTGLRLSEYDAVREGRVVGKGGKPRRVFGSTSNANPRQRVFRRELSRVGLVPHDLRKLFAQRLVERGVGVFDLMEIMGWSNLNTAQSYVAASKDLGSVVEAALDASD